MTLAQRLNMRQSQQLVMTPQLMQSIKLLTLSNIELSSFIEAEMERNPLLVLDDGGSGEASDQPANADVSQDISKAADPQPEWAGDTPALPVSEQFDTDVDNVFTPEAPDAATAPDPLAERQIVSDGPSATPIGGGEAGEAFDFEAMVATELGLHDVLDQQIGLLGLCPADRLIAADLLEWVDQAGYMRAEPAEVAERLGTEIADVEAVLEVLQTLEPAGVFARDLQQCLALQLAARDRLDPAMAALLENLDLLARREFAALEKACGVDREDIIEMVHEIRALDPKPGTAFSTTHTQTVVPDVIVTQAPDGSWAITLNQDSLPRVLVDRDYHATVAASATGENDKAFLTDCLQTANWLTKSLDQRAKTVLKVSAEIVAQQDGFLVHGVELLRPLNLKQVADAIEVHDSTVSRVTTNKYMQTPRGIFELKYFFSSGVGEAGAGEAHSAVAVKHRIQQMVDAETPNAILSDDAIVDALGSHGIDIARRTVAKYRDALSIPSSVQRRREKRGLAAKAS
ncbi:MAG: RNA polymerase factor sigma-54 [Pseudomonadota bacterium]